MAKHEPSTQSREQVRLMAAYGTIPECIAAVVGISVTELNRSYRHELDTAEIEAVAKVAETMYEKALKGDIEACKFILATRGGWKVPK